MRMPRFRSKTPRYSMPKYYADAERLLADRERDLGPDHPDTLIARVELGTLDHPYGPVGGCLAGKWADVLADCERVLGPGHPSTKTAQAYATIEWRNSQPRPPDTYEDPSWR